MEYRFKHLVFDIHPKNPPEWDRPLCVIDQGIACNDDYLFKYNRYRKHKSEVFQIFRLLLLYNILNIFF